MKPILILGLPGSGKTTLAKVVAEKLNAVHWNADEVRANVNKDLGFLMIDRIEQATRMGWLARNVTKANVPCVVDFVCPTPETREAFGDAFIVWVDRIKEGRFEDTNRLFVAPQHYDLRIEYGLSIDEELALVLASLKMSDK